MLKSLLLTLSLTTTFPPIFSQQQNNNGIYFPEDGESILDFVNRAGMDEVVTPDPAIPGFGVTLTPQVLIKDGVRCTCAPYFMCRETDETTTINVAGPDAEGCVDVLDVCCRPEDSLVIPTNNTVTNQPNQPRGCGIRNIGGIDFTLTGNFNNEAGFGEFPWTVALIRVSDNNFVCGGSLIHPQLVLTGAHCAATYGNNQLKIRAGEWDTQTTKERLPYQERLVKRILAHQEFNQKSLANDVAILELDRPVVLADHINIACLPPANYQTNRGDCFASGWGKNLFGKSGQYSVIMKKVPLPIVQSPTCEAQLQSTRLSSRFRLHRTFICAGGEEGVDTCQGDGGAPLVCPIGRANENRYAQIGSVAWGIGCHQKIPAVYTNMLVMRPWIDNIVRTLGYDTTVYDATTYQ